MRSRLKSASVQQWIFLGVALLVMVQLSWWIRMQVRQSADLLAARIEVLRAGRAEAWQMDSRTVLPYYAAPETVLRRGEIVGQLPKLLPTLEQRRKAIEAAYPHVAVVASPRALDDPQLVDEAAFLTLRQEPIRQLEESRLATLWKAGLEGAFMAAAVLFGFVLIYRKLAQEMDLKLRQRNFISAVTHELKTPIASLRVWMETLFQRVLSDEQKAKIHTRMDQDLARLAELVSNLLEVARADAGSLEMIASPLEVAPWLRNVCEGMDQRLGPGALGLQLDLGEGLWVMADAKQLATVVENLLTNAFKYAHPPRVTTITLGGSSDEVILVVQDQGVGIAPKELPRLFQRFYRVGDEMTRQVPGTGIGLFLTREIVERHAGEIRVASRGAGLGSTFTLRLPRIPAPRNGQAAAEGPVR
ncbi:MAG TPA: HAMP domain-containing sensor histidine kinase [Holophagaceae bacterium]|nr:HAMP domain-containing sensor histidine kinase [Holophagaceae bacterium]